MNKGDSKCLGKCVMGVMKKHREEEGGTYAKEGMKVVKKTPTSTSPESDLKYMRFKEAIHSVESGGKWKDDPYRAVNDSTATGKYQFIWESLAGSIPHISS